MKRLSRLFFLVVVAVLVRAALQQRRQTDEQVALTGRVLGVPYDFRKPTLQRVKQRWWNPNDPRFLTPKTFGAGWDINLYQVKRRLAALLDSGTASQG